MGWFSKKRAVPYADDLSHAETAWLQQQRDAARTLGEQAGLAGDPIAVCDGLIRCWHAASSRPDPNPIVNAAGVAVGDVLAREFGLEWKIITDSFGTDMGLWRARGSIILAPTSSVAKRFADGKDGFLPALLEDLRGGLNATMSALG
jgi:hypothetical protein